MYQIVERLKISLLLVIKTETLINYFNFIIDDFSEKKFHAIT